MWRLVEGGLHLDRVPPVEAARLQTQLELAQMELALALDANAFLASRADEDPECREKCRELNRHIVNLEERISAIISALPR